MLYRVDLSAVAFMKGSVEVEAVSSKAAKEKALAVANDGDVDWKYDGLDDNEGITTNAVTQVS